MQHIAADGSLDTRLLEVSEVELVFSHSSELGACEARYWYSPSTNALSQSVHLSTRNLERGWEPLRGRLSVHIVN